MGLLLPILKVIRNFTSLFYVLVPEMLKDCDKFEQLVSIGTIGPRFSICSRSFFRARIIRCASTPSSSSLPELSSKNFTIVDTRRLVEPATGGDVVVSEDIL